MIEVKDKFKFIFDIGDRTDFIQPEDVEEFTLCEKAGNILPTFEASLALRDRTLIPYFHEGSILTVKYGRDDSDLVETRLRILNTEITKSGSKQSMVYINGVYDAIKFLTETKCYITSPEKSSAEVIEETASSSGFSVSNEAQTDDSMKWISWSLTPKSFTNHLWRHSWIEESSLMLGITSDGEYRIRDLSKVASSGAKFEFTADDSDGGTLIHYDGDFVVRNRSGLFNRIMGYDRGFKEVDQISGEDYPLSQKGKAIMARDLNRMTVPEMYTGERPINDNVHDNFWKAYTRNQITLANASTGSVDLSFNGVFYRVKVLDPVIFKDEDPGVANRITDDQNTSGKYIVTRVTRTLAKKTLTTTCELCREANDNLKGGGIS